MKKRKGKLIRIMLLACIMSLGSTFVSMAAYLTDGNGNYFLYGDANADETNDVRDIVRMRLHQKDAATEISDIAADMDGNGVLNDEDVEFVRELLVGANNMNNGGPYWSDLY